MTREEVASKISGRKTRDEIPSGHSGVWDTKLRNICYEIVRNGSSMINSRSGSRYDQIGYVDKDAEKIIGDYKEA